jgi:hypothetical protein
MMYEDYSIGSCSMMMLIFMCVIQHSAASAVARSAHCGRVVLAQALAVVGKVHDLLSVTKSVAVSSALVRVRAAKEEQALCFVALRSAPSCVEIRPFGLTQTHPFGRRMGSPFSFQAPELACVCGRSCCALQFSQPSKGTTTVELPDAKIAAASARRNDEPLCQSCVRVGMLQQLAQKRKITIN